MVAVLTRHDLEARRVADGRRVTCPELHARLSQTIQVRRIVLSIAITAQLFSSEIVGHDDNEIRRPVT
jgi:hypothetical protein